MAGHRYRDRLPSEDQGQPGAAWIDREDGTRVMLALTPGDLPGRWVASPPDGQPAVLVGPGDHLRVDVLYSGQEVVFDRVWAQGGGSLVPEADE